MCTADVGNAWGSIFAADEVCLSSNVVVERGCSHPVALMKYLIVGPST